MVLIYALRVDDGGQEVHPEGRRRMALCQFQSQQICERGKKSVFASQLAHPLINVWPDVKYEGIGCKDSFNLQYYYSE